MLFRSCQLVPSLDPTNLTRAVTTIQLCISENAPPTLCSLARWRTQKRANPKLRNARLPSSLQPPGCQIVPSLDPTNLTRAVTTMQLRISENARPTLCSLARFCSLAHWKTQNRPNPQLRNARLPSWPQPPSCQLVPSLDPTNLTRAVTTIQFCISENAPPTPQHFKRLNF